MRVPRPSVRATGLLPGGLLVCGVLAFSLWQPGCARTPPAKTGNGEGAVTGATADPLAEAAQLLQKTATLERCQDALRLATNHLNQHPDLRSSLKLAQREADLLRDRFRLTTQELAFLDRAGFEPLDAYHLELCYRLRDAAGALGLHALPPLERARAAFDWVVRQVALDTSDDYLLPPQFVLQRGRGTPEERAVLFVALLQQLELAGCMVAVPGEQDSEKRYWLPGVLLKDGEGEGVYLFDTRLGVPVPGPGGKGVATLAQVRKVPGLLGALSAGNHAYDVKPGQAAKASVHLVSSLPALSPRMRLLEEELNKFDRVALAVRPVELLERFEQAVGEEVDVWNPPGTGTAAPRSPLRALELFLPREQGGTVGPELYHFIRRQQIPWGAVLEQYRRMGLMDDLPPAARAQLLNITEQLFNSYVLKPEDKLTRGRIEEILRPLERIRTVLNDIEAAPQSRFDERLREWVGRVRAAFLTGDPQQAAGLWTEDQFLLLLAMSGDEEQDIPRDLRPDVPTFVVVKATAERLTQQTTYLLARYFAEKAERARLQLLARTSPPDAAADQKARDAWGSAEDWSRRYLESVPLAGDAVRGRLQQAAQRWQEAELDLEPLELLFKDLHFGAAGRLLHAQALAGQGDAGRARDAYEKLSEETAALAKNEELAGALAAFEARVATSGVAPPVREALTQRLQQFRDTLRPGGSLNWAGFAAAYRAGQLGEGG